MPDHIDEVVSHCFGAAPNQLHRVPVRLRSITIIPLDYDNCVIFGLPAAQFRPPQSEENAAVLLISQLRRFDEVSDALSCHVLSCHVLSCHAWERLRFQMSILMYMTVLRHTCRISSIIAICRNFVVSHLMIHSVHWCQAFDCRMLLSVCFGCYHVFGMIFVWMSSQSFPVSVLEHSYLAIHFLMVQWFDLMLISNCCLDFFFSLSMC